MAPYSIAIIGVGKIARDQHLKVIAGNPSFRLVGVVSRSGAQVGGRAHLRDARRALRGRAGPRSGGDLHAAQRPPSPGARGARRRQARPARKTGRADAGGNARFDRPRRGARSGHLRRQSFAIPSPGRTGPASPPRASAGARWRSNGPRTCASGIPASNGSGKTAISACSIPASTRCRSSPKSRRGRCSSKAPSSIIRPTATRRSPLRSSSPAPPPRLGRR